MASCSNGIGMTPAADSNRDRISFPVATVYSIFAGTAVRGLSDNFLIQMYVRDIGGHDSAPSPHQIPDSLIVSCQTLSLRWFLVDFSGRNYLSVKFLNVNRYSLQEVALPPTRNPAYTDNTRRNIQHALAWFVINAPTKAVIRCTAGLTRVLQWSYGQQTLGSPLPCLEKVLIFHTKDSFANLSG